MKSKILILLIASCLLGGCLSTMRDTIYTQPDADGNVEAKPIATAVVQATGALPIPYLTQGLTALLTAGALAVGTHKKRKEGATNIELLHGVTGGLKEYFNENPEVKKAITGKIVAKIGAEKAAILSGIVKKVV